MQEHMKCVGTSNARSMIESLVAEGRWGVIAVLSSAEGPPFCYTVGLHHLGFPELILVGIGWNVGGQLLNNAADQMISNKRAFQHGEESEAVANLPAVFITADKAGDHTVQAAEFYGHSDFTVLQMVWPDRDGQFPWHERFDHSFDHQQPMLTEHTMEQLLQAHNRQLTRSTTAL
jgi:hypothetical protein